jgi:hypothetical protein
LFGPDYIGFLLSVSQQQFAKALNRPLLIKTLGWVINIFTGEVGELLKGKIVIPSRLGELSFKLIDLKLEFV